MIHNLSDIPSTGAQTHDAVQNSFVLYAFAKEPSDETLCYEPG